MGDRVVRADRKAITIIATMVLVAVVALTLADRAEAKGNMRATLDQPIPADSTPGKLITVGWKLEVERPRSARKSGAGKYQPFGAGEVFVRLIGPAGSQPTEAIVDGKGHFTAAVRVPSGGVKDVKIGIKGSTIGGDGTRRASDYMIPISGLTLANAYLPHAIDDGGLFTEDHLAQLIIFGAFGLPLILLIKRRSNARRNKPVTAAS